MLQLSTVCKGDPFTEDIIVQRGRGHHLNDSLLIELFLHLLDECESKTPQNRVIFLLNMSKVQDVR